MKKLIILLCIINNTIAFAQYPRVDIPGSEVRKITSAIVAGQEYELHILLPGGYATSTKKYPVVYLMDSQWDFPLVKCLYGQHYYDGFIPGLIVVGVTWGGVHPNPDSLRSRDYTPINESRLPQSGGADRFLSFMKNELFPFIETNYKADAGNRTLMGCSQGGLFTLYTLFTQPELFTGYVAASPAVGWGGEVLYKYETAFAQKQLAKPLRVYMTVGDVERSRPVFERMAAKMSAGKYAGVSLRWKVLENTGHSGTKSETYSRGMQYIFEKPKLQLAAAVLNRYTGTYQLPGGNTIEIKNEQGGLVLYVAANNKYNLYAASESEFYATSEFMHVNFQQQGGTLAGFQWERYGSSQFIKRVAKN